MINQTSPVWFQKPIWRKEERGVGGVVEDRLVEVVGMGVVGGYVRNMQAKPNCLWLNIHLHLALLLDQYIFVQIPEYSYSKYQYQNTSHIS